MIDRPFADLDAWVAFFTQAELPVLRHTQQELERLRDNAENVNGRVLSAAILRDPLMTLRVLAYIEERRKGRQTTDITTIERALMMIGVGPFFRDFNDLPKVEEQLKSHPQALLGLIKVTNRSRKAAHWAREWAILRHDLDVDEITVATLLHNVIEILMWCFAPSLALKVRELQAADRTLRTANAQMMVYGVKLPELQLELTRVWRLPELLATLINPDHAENPRVRNVALAVNLARHSANGWDDAALPDDFKDIRELLHVTQPQLIRRLGVSPEITEKLLADAALDLDPPTESD